MRILAMSGCRTVAFRPNRCFQANADMTAFKPDLQAKYPSMSVIEAAADIDKRSKFGSTDREPNGGFLCLAVVVT
ncbi:MAG: hypothetical protein AAGD43_03900 [Pseudomonadota bacterium]